MGGWVGGAGRFGGWRNALCRKIARNWVFCLCEYEYVGLTTTNWTLLGWARVLDCVQHSRKLWVNGFCLIFLFFFIVHRESHCLLHYYDLQQAEKCWQPHGFFLLHWQSMKVLSVVTAKSIQQQWHACWANASSIQHPIHSNGRLLSRQFVAKSSSMLQRKFRGKKEVKQERGLSEWQPDSLLGCIINVIKCGNCLAQCKTDLELDVNASIEAPSTGPAPSLKLQAPSQLGPPFWLQLPICTRNRRRCH